MSYRFGRPRVRPTCRMRCPRDGIESASSDNGPMGHPGGYLETRNGSRRDRRIKRRLPCRKTLTDRLSQVPGACLYLVMLLAYAVAHRVAHATMPKARALNSLRLSNRSPRATYHRDRASLRITAMIALPLRPPSRLILL